MATRKPKATVTEPEVIKAEAATEEIKESTDYGVSSGESKEIYATAAEDQFDKRRKTKKTTILECAVMNEIQNCYETCENLRSSYIKNNSYIESLLSNGDISKAVAVRMHEFNGKMFEDLTGAKAATKSASSGEYIRKLENVLINMIKTDPIKLFDSYGKEYQDFKSYLQSMVNACVIINDKEIESDVKGLNDKKALALEAIETHSLLNEDGSYTISANDMEIIKNAIQADKEHAVLYYDAMFRYRRMLIVLYNLIIQVEGICKSRNMDLHSTMYDNTPKPSFKQSEYDANAYHMWPTCKEKQQNSNTSRFGVPDGYQPASRYEMPAGTFDYKMLIEVLTDIVHTFIERSTYREDRSADGYGWLYNGNFVLNEACSPNDMIDLELYTGLLIPFIAYNKDEWEEWHNSLRKSITLVEKINSYGPKKG